MAKIKKLAYFTIELIFNTIYGHIELFELFMGLTVLFQLTFIFIYSIFSKSFQFQQNKYIPNRPLISNFSLGGFKATSIVAKLGAPQRPWLLCG